MTSDEEFASKLTAPTGKPMPNSTSSDASSPGRMIRLARERRGVHIEVLAAALKVPVRKLEWLEQDQYDQLHDVVFFRSLASGVCRQLQIDPQPVLALMPQAKKTALPALEGPINAPIGRHNFRVIIEQKIRVINISYLIFLLLILGSLVLFFWPESNDKTELAAEPLSPVNVPLTEAPAQTVLPMASPPSTPATTQPLEESSKPASAQSTPVMNEVQNLLKIQTQDESWVEVKDAKGVQIIRKNLMKGESFETPIQGPMSVVVGKAAVTTVLVRGQKLDLASLTRENVARFEVK